jgi:pimeloyl-ACP methyl ester carboxylesterase
MPVRHLVLQNPMIPAPGETAGEWWANTDQGAAMRRSDEAAGRDPDAEFDERAMFFHDVPDDLTAEAYAGDQPEESDAAFATPSLIDRWPDVPTTVVVGRDDRLFPVEFQRRVARERIGVDPVEIAGGHLNSLSQPEELAAALLKVSAG